MSEEVRAVVMDGAATRGESLASLSRLVGRNAAYFQQFIERGTPRRLPEDVRLVLAKHWRIDERLLGARDPWTPAREKASHFHEDEDMADSYAGPQKSAISAGSEDRKDLGPGFRPTSPHFL